MLRLITIPISHYCEKARWSLEYAGLDFNEAPHLPLFHHLPALRAGGGHTVPVLVTPEGTLRNSADIVMWVNARLPPDWKLIPDRERNGTLEFMHQADREFGVDTRLWVYSQVLPVRELALRIVTAKVPSWQQRLARPTYSAARAILVKRLGVNAVAVERALTRIDRLFDRVDASLADGRLFLFGDRFTVADLTFASLAAPLLSPPEYHVSLARTDELAEEAAKRVSYWRDRPAGAHALRMFREYRRFRRAPMG